MDATHFGKASPAPFSLDAVGAAGAGGASIRMKLAKASMSETRPVRNAGFVLELAGVVVKLSVSLGVGL